MLKGRGTARIFPERKRDSPHIPWGGERFNLNSKEIVRKLTGRKGNVLAFSLTKPLWEDGGGSLKLEIKADF